MKQNLLKRTAASLVLLLVFMLSINITPVYAAGEVYAIYKSDKKCYSCNNNGGNVGGVIDVNSQKSITNLFIAKDVKFIPDNKAYPLLKLNKVIFMDNNVKRLENNAFFKSALSSIVIPESVGYIGFDVFLECSNLSNVAIMNRGKIRYASSSSTFNDTNSNLRVYVYPTNANMSYLEGNKVPHKTVIAPPAELNAVVCGDITLNWTVNTDATSYKVVRSESENGTYTQLGSNTKNTTYTDATAVKGKPYWYKVYSVYDTKTISNWADGPVLESDPKVVTATLPNDNTPPTITQGIAQRNSTTNAIVKFTSSEKGKYYYSVVEDGVKEPTIDTSLSGTECIEGENTITLSNLTAGTKDAYIVVKDEAGNLSNSIKVDIEYDSTKLHKVSYDGNGNTSGNAPYDARSYLPNDMAKVSEKGDLVKIGYHFDSWNTKADGTGVAYNTDSSFTMGTENITLYAQWKEGTRYEAENATIVGANIENNIEGASGKSQVGSINAVGRYVEFSNIPAYSKVSVRYASNVSGKISVYLNNDKIKNLNFTSTGGWSGVGKYKDLTFDVNIPKDGKLKIQFDEGDGALNLDYIEVLAVPVTKVTLNETTMNLTAGGSIATLIATVLPDNASNKNVRWSSSNPKVATVENGVVTPVAEGTTTITVSTENGSKTAYCEVAVMTAVKDCPITYRGVQKKDNGDGTYDICFLATIDTLDVDEVGFVFSKSHKVPVKGKVKSSQVRSTTKVYKSVNVMNSNITAESKDGKYIFACTVTGISEKEVDKPLYLRAFITKGAEIKYTEAYTVTVKDIK